MSAAVRLYDTKHPYYCASGNYFSSECHLRYETWEDFIAEEGDSDLDMNLVFRWDWSRATDDDEKILPTRGDERQDTLSLFFMGQGKALCRSVEIAVCRDDEPAIRTWLATRWEHMRKLWAPFAQ